MPHRPRRLGAGEVGNYRFTPGAICRLTLYCTPEQDIHASDAGYAAIADAFWTASGYGQLAGKRASEGDRD